MRDPETVIVPCDNKVACAEPKVEVQNETAVAQGNSSSPLFRFKYTPVCNEGYYGLLCRECDVAGGYGRAGTAGSFCSQCPAFSTNTLLLGVLMLLYACVVAWTVARKSKKNKSSLTRILMTYVQFHSYASFLRADWPENVRFMYQTEETLTTVSFRRSER